MCCVSIIELFFSVLLSSYFFFFFFFNDTATTEIYTLSLHDALPIYIGHARQVDPTMSEATAILQFCRKRLRRSEEHTSELQSPCNLVCRLLLEKKKKKITDHISFTN